jgi:hypothetical protein
MPVTIKDKLTNLCGNELLQNDFLNTFCEIESWIPAAPRVSSKMSLLRKYLPCKSPISTNLQINAWAELINTLVVYAQGVVSTSKSSKRSNNASLEKRGDVGNPSDGEEARPTERR